MYLSRKPLTLPTLSTWMWNQEFLLNKISGRLIRDIVLGIGDSVQNSFQHSKACVQWDLEFTYSGITYWHFELLDRCQHAVVALV